MRRWQYEVLDTRQDGVPLLGCSDRYGVQIAEALNEHYGAFDWELCGCPASHLWIFKRRLRPRWLWWLRALLEWRTR